MMEPQLRPPPEFTDKHMIANVEGVLIHEYLQRQPGPVPSKTELRAFVAGLADDEALRIVRSHAGLRSLAEVMRSDADVLRWLNALKCGPTAA